ncbi:MAG TPA: hypothetical protein VHB25_14270 [Gemmatimonadaceae bacterium]|nr:hypothetical protein [Gemmatimonadaceae bacterium]
MTLSIALMLLPLARPAGAQDVILAVRCHAQRLNRAERATCASAGLAQLTMDVDSATFRLERMLQGADREALIDTEGPLRAERNACANEADVGACVDRVLRARIAALGAAMALPSSIQAEVAKYQYLNVAYVRRWGDRLIGRHVRVWGCLLLDSSAPLLTGTRSGVVRNTCTKSDQPELPVVMTRTAPERMSFYEAQPTSYWAGVVERRGGRLTLLMRP